MLPRTVCFRSTSLHIDHDTPPRQRLSTSWTRFSVQLTLDKVCALVLLDLNAAFDTEDHATLLTVLKDRFSVHDGALDWLTSYLTGRTQLVSASTGWSEPTHLTCGVPQGSVIGPVKFIAYTEDICTVIDTYAICHHSFANDTQLLAMASLTDVNSVRRRLECCVSDIQQWCTRRRLQLNHEKSELIWFGGRRNLEHLQAIDTTICLGDIGPAERVRNLGVMLDSSLSLHQHIAKVISTCFFTSDGFPSSAVCLTSTPGNGSSVH